MLAGYSFCGVARRAPLVSLVVMICCFSLKLRANDGSLGRELVDLLFSDLRGGFLAPVWPTVSYSEPESIDPFACFSRETWQHPALC